MIDSFGGFLLRCSKGFGRTLVPFKKQPTYLFILFIFEHLPVRMCACCLRRTEVGVRSPGTEVRAGVGHPVGAGT